MEKAHDKISDASVKSRIRLYQNAVSSTVGTTVKFSSIGGTGDHVGGETIDAGNEKYVKAGEDGIVEVPTITLDHVIENDVPNKSIYMVKIDTQGHEMEVFSGFWRSVSKGLVRYILFEYWVDAMDEAAGVPFGSCEGVQILEKLKDFGYEVFDLSVLAHPKAPKERKAKWKSKFFRPLSFNDNCKYFSNMGQEDRDVEIDGQGYGMG